MNEEQPVDSPDLERRFRKTYEILEPDVPLGEGAFGKVYKGRHTRTGKLVALKKMTLDTEEEGVPTAAVREIGLLKELSHPNIVELLDVFCTLSKLTLVFELVGEDLKKYMKSVNFSLSPTVVKNLSFQLCCGVCYCHASRILHRDIKPQNLLIDSKLHLKIADFGLARFYTVPAENYTHEVITVWYRAIEILLGSPNYGAPVDMWSVSCVMCEMATGSPFFAGDSEIDTIFLIFQKLGTPTVEECPQLLEMPDFKPSFPKWRRRPWTQIRNMAAQVGTSGINFAEEALAYNASKRLTAHQAVKHAYFADVSRSQANGCSFT